MRKCGFVRINRICGVHFILLCGVMTTTLTHAKEIYENLSPISLVTDSAGKKLFIADATARRITVFDTGTKQVSDTIALKQNPGGLALAPEESFLYVATGSSEGTVEIVDLKSRRVVNVVKVGHTPCAPVVSRDGRTLFVCNRFNDNLSVIDLSKNREITRIPMLREPIAADITPDGKYLCVANHLPTGRIIYEYVRDAQIMMIGSYMSQGAYGGRKMDYAASGVVLVVDTSSHRLVELIPLRDGATGLRGICVSPDGENVYVTHLLANYKVPSSAIERGAINANAVSIISMPDMKLRDTILLDDADRGAANPWDVKCSQDGKYLCVSLSGTHEICVIDRLQLHGKLGKTTGNQADNKLLYARDVTRDLTFLTGLRKRFQLGGDGPRGMAIAGSKVYAAEYFSDSVGMIDCASPDTTGGESIALGHRKPLTETRRGELLFNDARICFQNWQSCASCHPDGRADGLNWDLLNDGTGNPKQTKSLLFSHKTPPSMITGIRSNAETAVRAGLRHILFSEQPEETAAAMDTYLRSLKPVPSPYLRNGKLSEAAKRGKKTFEKTGCGKCHIPPLYTDMKKYDVGVGTDSETNREFDTPTLIEAWRTSPYLYDGRAELMYEVFMWFNKNDTHGEVSKIDKKYLFDLAEYVLSL